MSTGKKIISVSFDDQDQTWKTDLHCLVASNDANQLIQGGVPPEKLVATLREVACSVLKPVKTVTATKSTPKTKLPIILDSDDKSEFAMDTGLNSIPDLTTPNQEEEKPVEKPIIPLPSFNLEKESPEKTVLPSAETTPEPPSDKEEEAPDKELFRSLVKKHVKIDCLVEGGQENLTRQSSGKSEYSTQTHRQQSGTILCQGMEPLGQEEEVFPAPPKNKAKKHS
ncbi:hypothetical protein MJO28_003046 [Puccinia striiformis f. sp. tritici]|uniref:Uncharacterized protein n=1 Tax=Puccinia striiformis f. sp. tritici TaxID=168172 RepID=A0ACC0EV40_9BASI|nr:hypothetical protein MJO28_003046 [Puccinia striiformis f. sp. tritici]KAI7965024.1 hypothetical protein MJO29_003122 [Puccinia striiformis f. sp. tritici]